MLRVSPVTGDTDHAKYSSAVVSQSQRLQASRQHFDITVDPLKENYLDQTADQCDNDTE